MTAPELPIQDVSGEDRLRVTGAPHYQEALAAASGPKRSGGVTDRRPFALVAEPDNPHDPQAIAVHLEGGAKIGYLPREEAQRYGRLLDAVAARGRRPVSDGVVLGGDADRDTLFVVWLHIQDPFETLSA
ncbi:MAG TPA: HIRAN domain-containing protein [Solirubrobacteraceae bacterium]|nr:HIRAN domain-containing protein [Solirubrobacteraceae bacterium]